MKRRVFSSALFSVFLASPAISSPLWDSYPVLICRYDKVQFCLVDMKSCKGSEGTAVLTFDFGKSEVRSLVSNKPQPISGRYFFASSSGDINTVLSNSTLYSFGSLKHDPPDVDIGTIEGVAQSGMGFGGDSVFNAHMTCHPQS